MERLRLAIITSQIHYQPKYFRFVPGEAIRRGRGIHLQPNGRGQLTDTAQNRRDEKDCLSTRPPRRRLDISLNLEATKRPDKHSTEMPVV
jgi:hypothetical protein